MAKSNAQIPDVRIARIDRMTLSEIEAKGLSHLLTQRKKIKRQPGRPRVIPDRRFQFSMSYWYGLIAADYHSLPRYQRARIAVECWKALLSRMKAIPSDPNESKMNAEEAMRMLGKLEGLHDNTSTGEKTSGPHPAAEGGPAPDVVLAGLADTVKAPVLEDAMILNDQNEAQL